jgi:MYXO-CTERM domain-containing protein
MIDQHGGLSSFVPDATVITATLLIQAAAPGARPGRLSEYVLRLWPHPGDVLFSNNAANATVVPKPGTLALLGVGLATRTRRR